MRRKLALLLAGDLRRASRKVTEARLCVADVASWAEYTLGLPDEQEIKLHRALLSLDAALDELRGSDR